MTLRLRMVLALTGLVLIGLGLFGVATYSIYARSQYQRLDDQIRAAEPFVTGQLQRAEGATSGGFGPDNGPQPDQGQGRGSAPDRGGPGPGPAVPISSYAELRGASDEVLAQVALSSSTARPKLPTHVDPPGTHPRFFTTGASVGSGKWRVFVGRAPGSTTEAVIIAVPTGEVTGSLHRLVLVEAASGAALLAVLVAGAWLILRHGLRPLESMAVTAGSIAGGDLSQRVSPAGGRSEVGQLGSALNTMLDEIEAGFAEREATEQKLRQFLADASHELRTPLTSIRGFAELFRVGGAGSQVDLATILRRIEQESDRMRGLVDDLLLLARVDQTREVESAPVDLAVLAADACSDAVAADPGRAVTLAAPGPVVVRGDQALLRQAIANLVTNAVRHTPAGSPVEVTAGVDGGLARVTVRDHGGGLSDEALAHVFDRFWQADRARAGAGSGLGLSIVAAIAAEHGGAAAAANAPDGGAMFTLELPVEGPVAAVTHSGGR